MDRPLPQAPRAQARRRGRLSALALALALFASGAAAQADRLVPVEGGRYVNGALGFLVDLPPRVAACHRPQEGWREGIVLVLGGRGCNDHRLAPAFVTVTGEPNSEALGDVHSLAASLCASPGFGEARVEAAPRAIAGRLTLACRLQDVAGNVAIEAMAQFETASPPVTWTNLRVALVARGDRWQEFVREFEDALGRVRWLPR
ncbi:MAG: hypothetical protein ACKOGH_14395 [Alphaproteobacteria bacterium]